MVLCATHEIGKVFDRVKLFGGWDAVAVTLWKNEGIQDVATTIEEWQLILDEIQNPIKKEKIMDE
jgi:hypothetical protein